MPLVHRGTIFRFVLLPAVVGLAATVAVYAGFLRKGGISPRATSVTMVPVVVARQSLDARTQLEPEMLEVRLVPREYAFKGSLREVQAAAGKVLTAPVAAGEPVLRNMLAAEENKVALAYHVPPGMRAVTIQVGEVSGVAGRLEVGDRVDVLAHFTGRGAVGARSVLLLEDVPVLALGRPDPGAGRGNREGSRYTSVTLAVTPADALRLGLGEEIGRLQLALRPAVKEGKVGKLSVTEQSLP